MTMRLEPVYFKKNLRQLAKLDLPYAAVRALTAHWSGDLKGALTHHAELDVEAVANEADRALLIADRFLLQIKIGLGLSKDLTEAHRNLIDKYKASRFIKHYGEVCYYFWVDHKKAWQSLRRLLVVTPLVRCRGAMVLGTFLAGHLWAIAGKTTLGYVIGSAAFHIAWALEGTPFALASFSSPGIYACFPYTLLVSGRMKIIHRIVASLEQQKRDPFYDAIFLVSALYAYAYSADLVKTDTFVTRFTTLHARGEFLRYQPVSKIVGLLPIALRGYGHLIQDRLEQVLHQHDDRKSDPLINSQFYRAAATVALLSSGDRATAATCLDKAERFRKQCRSFQTWQVFDQELRTHIQRSEPVRHWDLKFLHIPNDVTSSTRLGDLGLSLMSTLPEGLRRGTTWFDQQAATIVADYFGLGLHRPAADEDADLAIGTYRIVFSGLSDSRRTDMRSVLTEVSLAVRNVRHTLDRMIDMQQNLEAANRHATVAKTAQMVAHDIRKPFSLMRMGLDALKSASIDKIYLEELDHRVSTAMRDAQDMLNDVLVSGTPSASVAKEFAVGEVVERAVADALVSRNLPINRININIAKKGKVIGSAAKMRRALINLVENALDAAGDQDAVWVSADLSGDQTVVIVGNRGKPIPAGVMDRLFEPYFTHGKADGTGLGLAVVEDVVGEFNGSVEVTSTPENGTIFTIRLPLPQAAQRPIEQVAVIDDDAFILDAWRHTIGTNNVVTYDSPAAFWRQMTLTPGLLARLDAVVTDQYFDDAIANGDQHPDGLSFAHSIKLARADLPVFLSSNADISVTASIKLSIDAVIEKEPISLTQLSTLVAQLNLL